jgi:hypothetical protein
MKYINQIAEVYRIDTEEEVKQFNEELKEEAVAEGYTLKSFSYTLKEKKKNGEVQDAGYQVKVVKEFASFWDC